jgi:DNA-directed RNA polymerase sigma subunit (sigma70/sigma32)
MIMALGNDGIIDWEGISVKDFPRYKKIRRVLASELEDNLETVGLFPKVDISSDCEPNIELGSDFEKKVQQLLLTLNSRESDILKRYFSLNGYKKHTLEGIAQTYDLSRSRIYQIFHKALRKLRHPKRSKIIEEYKNGHSWGR